jgi:hypothetical protein
MKYMIWEKKDMTLIEAECNVGKKVIYSPHKNCNTKYKEYGTITSVNRRYAFVRYGTDVNSKATDPEDLTLDY